MHGAVDFPALPIVAETSMHVSRPSRLPRDPEAALWKALPRNLAACPPLRAHVGFRAPLRAVYASMVPSYLTVLGVSKSLMGFVQSFWTILSPLQLLATHLFSPRKQRMRSVITLYMLATGSRLAYDVLVVAVPVMWTPSSLVTFFVLANISYVGLLLLGHPSTWGCHRQCPRRGGGGCSACAPSATAQAASSWVSAPLGASSLAESLRTG